MPVVRKSSSLLENTIISGMTFIKEQNQKNRLYVSNSSYCARQGALAATFVGDVTQEPAQTGYFSIGNALEKSSFRRSIR